MNTILMIEDNYNLLKETTSFLRNNGYKPYGTRGGYEGLNLYEQLSPDLILLDLDMPDINGFDILRTVRAKDIKTRLIVISECADTYNQLLCFQLLADDFIPKPFEFPDLMSRIENSLSHERINNEFPYFEANGLIVDYLSHKVFLNNSNVYFTTVEFGILALLTKNAGNVVNYDELIKKTFDGIHINDMETLREEIKRIRKKIEQDPKNPKYVLTENRIGYKFNIA